MSPVESKSWSNINRVRMFGKEREREREGERKGGREGGREGETRS